MNVKQTQKRIIYSSWQEKDIHVEGLSILSFGVHKGFLLEIFFSHNSLKMQTSLLACGQYKK